MYSTIRIKTESENLTKAINVIDDGLEMAPGSKVYLTTIQSLNDAEVILFAHFINDLQNRRFRTTHTLKKQGCQVVYCKHIGSPQEQKRFTSQWLSTYTVEHSIHASEQAQDED